MSARSFDIMASKKQSNVQVSLVNNTRVVKLHGHSIVGWEYDSVRLDSCGWKTNTTKVAINRALSQIPRAKEFGVIQKKGEWFVVNSRTKVQIPFVDGMSINL